MDFIYPIEFVIFITEICMVLIYRPLFPPTSPAPRRCYITICTPPFASLKSEKFKILKPIRLQGSHHEQWGAMEGLRGAGAGSVVGSRVLRGG